MTNEEVDNCAIVTVIFFVGGFIFGFLMGWGF
jgi:hypothetical protein